MPKLTVETLAARLDVQAIAVQELARLLAPAQGAAVAHAIRLRVAGISRRAHRRRCRRCYRW